MKNPKLAIFQAMGAIDGKIIWITGASSGIGEALAYQLNNKGCSLIISARDTKRLEQVKQACETPKKVAVLPLDLLDFNRAETIVAKAWNIFGKIDVLINNAGVSQRSLILDTNFDVFQKMMDINYLGTVAISKALLPYYVNNKNGHFVVVTSLMGKFGSPYRSGYCGAKHALHGFFDVLRMEHEKDGVEVTLVCPGFVQTNVAKNAITKDGTPQQSDDEKTANGMPTEVFAKKMIRAIERKKFEVNIGGFEVSGVYLKRFFPKLLHRFVLNSQVK